MLRSISLALMEAENVRRATERAGRPALHPLAEFVGDWERAQREKPAPVDRSTTISLNGDDVRC